MSDWMATARKAEDDFRSATVRAVSDFHSAFVDLAAQIQYLSTQISERDLEINSLRAQLAKDTERERLIRAVVEAYRQGYAWELMLEASETLADYERSKGRG